MSRDSGASVLLIGMRIPPNYGATYTKAFHELFGELAAKHRLPLVPFFLDGIALDDSLMLDDGLHPNAAAQPKLLEHGLAEARAAAQTVKSASGTAI